MVFSSQAVPSLQFFTAGYKQKYGIFHLALFTASTIPVCPWSKQSHSNNGVRGCDTSLQAKKIVSKTTRFGQERGISSKDLPNLFHRLNAHSVGKLILETTPSRTIHLATALVTWMEVSQINSHVTRALPWWLAICFQKWVLDIIAVLPWVQTSPVSIGLGFSHSKGTSLIKTLSNSYQVIRCPVIT